MTGATGRAPAGGAVPRGVRVLLALMVAGIVATAVQVAADPLGDAVSSSWTLYGGTLMCCVVLCALRVRRRRDARAGWTCLGAGLAAIVAGGLGLSFGPPVPFPGPADLVMLAYYPLTYAGLVLLVRDTARRVPAGVWLDGLTTGLTLAAVTAAVAGSGPDRAGHTTAALVTGMAHPFGDLVLLTGLGAIAVVAGGGRRWLVLTAGAALTTIADVAYFAQTLGDGVVIPRWVQLVYLLSGAAVPIAAWMRPGPRPDRTSPRSALVAPVAAAVVALAVLVSGAARGEALPWTALALAALALLASVARTVLSFLAVVGAAENRRQAVTDELTGLGNRRLFAEASAAALRGRPPRAALLLVDLDRFKEVNDALGHPVGDDLLRRLGPRLTARLRPGETLARLGGDEFGLLVPGLSDHKDALTVAARVAGAFDDPIRVDGVDVLLTASIGVAVAPAHGFDAATLLRKADVAMYEAKRLGTGCELYRPSADRHSRERLQTATDLRRALDSGELGCHYQPQIDLATGCVTGVEALVRWNHPRRGVLVPDRFLAIAEQTGLMRPLTDVVVRTALADCVRWHSAGQPLAVSVNLSAESVVDRRLLARLGELLAESGLPPGVLTVEITEGSLLRGPERVRLTLVALRELGVSVSIDDYGVGYSSLSYLRELPIDELKLDRKLVTPIARDPRAAAIVASTVDLAHALGVRLVAEGVEDAAALERLIRLRCDRVQGYHLARPMVADAVLAWTRAYRPGVPDPAAHS